MRDTAMIKEANPSKQKSLAERGAVLGESGGFNAQLLNPLLPLFGGLQRLSASVADRT